MRQEPTFFVSKYCFVVAVLLLCSLVVNRCLVAITCARRFVSFLLPCGSGCWEGWSVPCLFVALVV